MNPPPFAIASMLLFDLDGVLADSTACVEHHWRQWAAQHRIDPDALLKRVHGRRAVDTIREVAPLLDADAEFRALAAAETLDTSGIVAEPGAVDFLKRLPNNRWGVVTSGAHSVAIARLNACGLREPPLLISAEMLTRGKPDPEGYLVAAWRSGYTPRDCVVFEDAPAGVAAAHAAGMRCVALTTTHPAAALANADWLVSSLAAVRVEFIHDAADQEQIALYQVS
ncbi:MAG: HAD-IA family hydrolase [Gemmatimonadaceae bacterium]